MKVTIKPRGEFGSELLIILDSGHCIGCVQVARDAEKERADLERMIQACVGEALANEREPSEEKQTYARLVGGDVVKREGRKLEWIYVRAEPTCPTCGAEMLVRPICGGSCDRDE